MFKRTEAIGGWELSNEPAAVDKTIDHLFALTKSLI